MNIGERKQPVSIFVGSTFEDLKKYRRAAENALTQLGMSVTSMEHFGSKSGTPVEECLTIIRTCQLYVGIFGMRYGSVPEGYVMSMTHLEYEEAQRCNLPSLIYILDEDSQRILPKHVETGSGAEKLRSLKERLRKRHVVTAFTTPQDLAAKILRDVPAELEKSSIAVGGGLTPTAADATIPNHTPAPDENRPRAATAGGAHTSPPGTHEPRASSPDSPPSPEPSRPDPKDERATPGVGQRGYHLVYQFTDLSRLSTSAQDAVIEKYLSAIPQVINELKREYGLAPMESEFLPHEDGGVVSFFGKAAHVIPYFLMKRMLALQETGAAQIRIGLHNGRVKMIQSPAGPCSLFGGCLIEARQIARAADPGGAAASLEYLRAIHEDLPEVDCFLARKTKLAGDGNHDIEYCKFNPSETQGHQAAQRATFFDRVFSLRARGTTVGRELLGGLSTFLVMSYIIFVQPTIIGRPGLAHDRIVIATCLASALGCFLMGFLGRYPIATAPGMGQNVFFALALYPLFGPRAALGIVLLAGCVVAAVASVAWMREAVLDAFPRPLRAGIVAGIGLLITLVGLEFAGVVIPVKDGVMPYVKMGDLKNAYVLIALAAVCVGLILHARNVQYALIVSIIIGGFGVVLMRHEFPNLAGVGIPRWPADGLPVVPAASFVGLLDRPIDAIRSVVVLALISLFDSVGSLLGVGDRAGLLQEGNLPRSRWALWSVSAGSIAGASMGTSTLVPYVESAAGVEAGARTGLAAVFTGVLFLAALLITPIVQAFGGGVRIEVGEDLQRQVLTIYPAIAPAVIVVGSLMLRDVRTIPWDDPTEALPAFLTMVVMAFTVNIMHGITFGVISYVLLKVCTGRRKEVQRPLYVCAFFFLLFYVMGGS